MAVSKIPKTALQTKTINVPVGNGTGRSDWPWKSGLIQALGVIFSVIPLSETAVGDYFYLPIVEHQDGTKFILYGSVSDIVPCNVIYRI